MSWFGSNMPSRARPVQGFREMIKVGGTIVGDGPLAAPASARSRRGGRKSISMDTGRFEVLQCTIPQNLPFTGLQSKSNPPINRASTERGRSSGVEHNLAKVGVEGSNPSARSSFLQGNEAIQMVVRGRFLLPRPPRESWGSRGEAAESEKQRAIGCRRHGGHPEATVFRLRDRRQWGVSRSTTKGGFGRHRTSQDTQVMPLLLHWRRRRCECEIHRSALPPARRIGSTSRSESGNRTNPCAA